eukprot:4018480-Amphidinium_carterae.1
MAGCKVIRHGSIATESPTSQDVRKKKVNVWVCEEEVRAATDCTNCDQSEEAGALEQATSLCEIEEPVLRFAHVEPDQDGHAENVNYQERHPCHNRLFWLSSPVILHKVQHFPGRCCSDNDANEDVRKGNGDADGHTGLGSREDDPIQSDVQVAIELALPLKCTSNLQGAR